MSQDQAERIWAVIGYAAWVLAFAAGVGATLVYQWAAGVLTGWFA